MKNNSLKVLLCILFLFTVEKSHACQCPITVLGLEECNKYDIIFKGKISSVKPCANNFGVAEFEIEELYKGNITDKFKVLFNCGVECAMEFSIGQEWIIYTRYKQVDKAMMDWCSRSRKFFKNDKEDFYTVTYGNDYFDELSFLRKNLGLHRTRKETINAAGNRNSLPTQNQTILMILISLSVIVLFYYLFNKYFKL